MRIGIGVIDDLLLDLPNRYIDVAITDSVVTQNIDIIIITVNIVCYILCGLFFICFFVLFCFVMFLCKTFICIIIHRNTTKLPLINPMQILCDN